MVTKPMVSPPSSKLSFYDKAGAIPGPIEGMLCGIAIDVPRNLRPSISLKLSGYSLPVSATEMIAYSEWPPCGPGVYELLLECGNIHERRTVTVMPHYFPESDITAMIHDLTETLPHKIASQLHECSAQLATLPGRSHEDEFLRLRNAVVGTKERMGMLQVLPILQRACHQILIPQLELRSANKVRRPDISKLPQAITIPGNVLTSEKIYQMFDITVERSFEAYENRLVKAYVLALRSRLSRLQTKLKSVQAPPAMAAELDDLINEFHLAYMRATFLREVKNPTVSSVRVTMVLLKNPAYRAVLEGYLALNQQSSVTLDESALSYPLNNFPYLYQRWAILKVLSATLQVCAEAGYQCVSHHWIKNQLKGISIKVMNDGRAAVQLTSATPGRVVNFIPWSAIDGTANFSGQESPMGVAIAIETLGKPIEVLVFDPKYWVDSKKAKPKAKEKASAKAHAEENDVQRMLSTIEPLKVDVDEVLRFKDHVKAAVVKSEIKYSAILYPGQRKQLAPDIEALPAHPTDGDGLQKIICDVIRPYLA